MLNQEKNPHAAETCLGPGPLELGKEQRPATSTLQLEGYFCRLTCHC